MERNELTVSQLNEYANTLLTENPLLKNIVVKGEISNYIHHKSGHRYFSLKDAGAAVACVMFSHAGNGLDFEPKDGDKVLAAGYVGVYKKDGRYQLYVKSMDREGKGSLFERFEAVKQKLYKEGLFDPRRKKKLPMLPRRVGIVTSHQGAAVQDMINIISRRFPGVDIVIYPAKVQGEGAHLTIMEGIAYFNHVGDVDVMIVGRGGGSLEDLWAFNEEPLARAIAASRVPVISAVGHETDFTIADFAADLRAPTPSAAAELCVPMKSELLQLVNTKRQLLVRGMNDVLAVLRARMEVLENKLLRFNPVNRIDQQRQLLMSYTTMLKNAITGRIEGQKARVAKGKAQLSALNPKGVLKRGYALVQQDNGRVVESAGQVNTGDKVTVVLHDGQFGAAVE